MEVIVHNEEGTLEIVDPEGGEFFLTLEEAQNLAANLLKIYDVGIHERDSLYYHQLCSGIQGLVPTSTSTAKAMGLEPCPYCFGNPAGHGQDWYLDIMEFHRTFGHKIGAWPRIPKDSIRALRSKLIREEVNELLDGMDDSDLEKVADGAADAIVVILGTCVSYGIDIRPIWDEVHRTNMAKVGGKKRADGKTLKPEGWKPPRIRELLDQQRKVS
jgi:predicted HAD superfamily Cof-like phosphohydrolase